MDEISMTSTASSLFESLQKEFCPTLDSSLLAALLLDIESDVHGIPVTPTRDQIVSLCATLKELSLQADECSGIEQSSYMDNTLREPILSWTTPSSFGVDTNHNETDSSQMSGSSSSSSSMSFSSPLGFLQMVLPDVSSARLRKALDTHDSEDLWDVIAFIVTEEAMRETEERGLEGSKGDGNDETGWEVVQRKRKEAGMTKKKTPTKPKKFILTDIRQHHHEQDEEHRSSGGISSSQSAPSTVDCWTRISSLSTRLAGLLPPHSPTTFSSFLHSPQYETSYDAVRACLTSLCKSNDLSDRQATLLVNLLDIIMPEEDELDIDMRSKIISDVELAVCTTEGQGDSALDLVYLLRDLDGPGMRLNSSSFSPALSPAVSTGAVGLPTSRPSPPTGPPDVPPPPSPRGKDHLSSKRSPLKIDTHQWQTVPSRAKPTHSIPRHFGPYLPTYSRGINGNKTTRAGSANHSHNLSARETGGNTDDSRVRMRQALTKSRQALMDAAIMYQKRDNKNHGGEVAFFYAERAREWKQIANREALNAAREMVLANSERKGKRDIIDLHGTTVAEALVIVREILDQRANSLSSGKPLRIITGKGNHSTGRVSVLKPALRSALTEDGWIVTTWDAGLVVRSFV